MKKDYTALQCKQVGDLFKEMRQSRGIKRNRLCHFVDIEEYTYNDIETGRRMPSLRNFIRLCSFYGKTDISEFISIFLYYDEE